MENRTMRRPLRLLALALSLGAAGYWAATGASPGWSKTSVPIRSLDEITGIEAITYEARFVPGVDFLGAILAAAALLYGVSYRFRPKSSANLNPTNP
jgi:hypothetical protein